MRMHPGFAGFVGLPSEFLPVEHLPVSEPPGLKLEDRFVALLDMGGELDFKGAEPEALFC